MVRYNNAVHPFFQGKLGIIRMHNSFQNNWQLGMLPQEVEILPGESCVAKYPCPMHNGSLWILLWRCVQLSMECRVGEIISYAFPCQKWQVYIFQIILPPCHHWGIQCHDNGRVAG